MQRRDPMLLLEKLKGKLYEDSPYKNINVNSFQVLEVYKSAHAAEI